MTDGHGVSFPVAKAAPLVDDRGTLLQGVIDILRGFGTPALSSIMAQIHDPAAPVVVAGQPRIDGRAQE